MQMSLAGGVYLNAISGDYVGRGEGDVELREGDWRKGCCRNNARNNKLQA